MSYRYEEIKLDKSFYDIPGKTFSAYLEELDPSSSYARTRLEGTDAFERQLIRFGLDGCTVIIDDYYSDPQSVILFPEFVRREVTRGMDNNGSIQSIISSRTIIEGLEYRTVVSTVEVPITGDPTISEGGLLHTVTINTNSNLIEMEKHGRLVSTTYEALRFQHVRTFAIILNKIGYDIVNENLARVITMLSSLSPVTAESLSYASLLSLLTAVRPYKMDVMLANADTIEAIMAITEIKAQTEGSEVKPLGAKLICANTMDDDQIIGLDSSCSFKMIQSGGLIIDSDKLIDRQLDKIGISITTGFARELTGSVKLLDFSGD